MTDQTAARRSALYLLDQVLGEGKLLPECLSAGALDRLAPEDRARAQRLALQTLRGLERADRMAQRHLRKAPPLHVRNALRLGIVELSMGGAAHGVVGAMVTIIGGHKRHNKLKGLVNAVLRKVAPDAPEMWETLRAPHMPRWLRGPLRDAWGAEAVAGMERAQFSGAPLDLTLKQPDPALAEMLGATVLPTGSLRVPAGTQVSALPGFDAGAWWVQDAAAALPVVLLDPQPGEQIADMCAAPGGKTLQLAAAGARVTAIDASASRLARLHANLDRTGLTAEVKTGDAREVEGPFDAVVLDAPCSATGTIRRHPDLPHAKDGAEFPALFALQAELLSAAWRALKPGGRMVYCTCSLLPDEGEVQIDEALARHPDMSVDRAALERPVVDPAWISSEGGLRLRPDYWADLGGMDGFYMAVLRKAL